MPVLGICNGFQILCESHLLPGALIRNDHQKFVCRDQRLRIENSATAWTSAYDEGAEITVVLKNGEGGYVADAETLDRLEGEGRVVARYLDVNPNGSLRDIAGITNERGNVVGLMPHPEHAVEDLTGPGTDGLGFFTSLLAAAAARGRWAGRHAGHGRGRPPAGADPAADDRAPDPRPGEVPGRPTRLRGLLARRDLMGFAFPREERAAVESRPEKFRLPRPGTCATSGWSPGSLRSTSTR